MFAVTYSLACQEATNSPTALPHVTDPSNQSLLAFDVVSIHPSNHQITPGAGIFPDGYRAYSKPLWMTILTAYLPLGTQSEELLLGAPRWVWDVDYDVVAKVTPEDQASWISHRGDPNPWLRNDPLQDMLQPMLRKALLERCRIAVRLTPKLVNGYALVLQKNGVKQTALKEWKADDVVPAKAIPLSGQAKVVPILSNDTPDLIFYRTSMNDLAARLPFGSSPVIDQTGLTGKYNFVLTRLNKDPDLVGKWDLADLGLKLIPTKVKVDAVEIIHIEKPTAN